MDAKIDIVVYYTMSMTVPLDNSNTVVLKHRIKTNDNSNYKLKNIDIMLSAISDSSQS